MYSVNEFPGRTLNIKGKDYLYFGGTSYLGLQIDLEFQSLFIANIKKYGTGYGASRKSNVQLSIFEEAETYLTNHVGSEACITLSSGYLAGQLISDYFNSSDYQLYYAPNTHCALYRSQNYIYPSWEKLQKEITANKGKIPVLLLDSIDFQGINFPDYKPLQNLPLDKIIVVVDDSHGIGITGNNGGGSFNYLESLNPKELIVSCSLAKGFGVQAGAIFGNRSRIEKLKNTAFFGGASPASPASLATIKNAHDLYHKKRKRLNRNTVLFLSLLANASRYIYAKGHPSFGFENEVLAKQLEKNGIITTNFRYPTEDDSLMSRIVISASHREEDITKLCSILNSIG